MKILKLIFKLIVIFLFIAIVALVIFVKTFDIQKYREQINTKISRQLGRDVQFEKISLDFSFQKGLTVVLRGVKLSDHPDFSNKYFLTVDSILLTADVMKFLKEREIYVSHIALQRPQIRIIRNLSGDLNVQSFAKPNVNFVNSQDSGQLSKLPAGKELVEASAEQTPFLIKKIYIFNGTIIYLDQKSKQLTKIPINSINVKISDFGFDKVFRFQSEFSLWSDVENIKFSGKMKIGQANGFLQLEESVLETDFAKLEWKDVRKDVKGDELAQIKEIEQGIFSLNIEKAVIKSGEIESIKSSGKLINGKINLEPLSVPVENIDLSFKVSETNFDISEIFLYVGTGKAMGSIMVRDYLTTQVFDYDLSFENFLAEELSSGFDLPFQLEGILFGSFNGEGKGFALEGLEKSLLSDIQIRMEEGKLKDINVVRLVLSKISTIPYLLENVEKNLPQRFKDSLNDKDTDIDQVELILKVDQGKIFIKEMKVGAEGFRLKSSGWIDFNENMRLETVFKIPEDLSSNIVSSVPELGALLDAEQQINIPFLTYEGKLQDVNLKVDTSFLFSRVIKQKGKQELKNLIFKALDLDEDEEPESSEKFQNKPGEEFSGEKLEKKEPVEKIPEAIIIKNILDTIFK